MGISPRHSAALAPLSFLAVATLVPPASAQHPKSGAPDSLRHIQIVEPRSGPIGTTVRVHTENLPLQAKIYVGVGATHDGWEELAEVPQGELGEVTAVVAIPDFATWDRPLVFIVFNGVFSPIGISDPFHVTDEQGHVRRSGQVETGPNADGQCARFRDADDYLYWLTGDVPSMPVGEPVDLEGRYTHMGPCGDGDTVEVIRLASGA